jgi:hypothetical protein
MLCDLAYLQLSDCSTVTQIASEPNTLASAAPLTVSALTGSAFQEVIWHKRYMKGTIIIAVE